MSDDDIDISYRIKNYPSQDWKIKGNSVSTENKATILDNHVSLREKKKQRRASPREKTAEKQEKNPVAIPHDSRFNFIFWASFFAAPALIILFGQVFQLSIQGALPIASLLAGLGIAWLGRFWSGFSLLGFLIMGWSVFIIIYGEIR